MNNKFDRLPYLIKLAQRMVAPQRPARVAPVQPVRPAAPAPAPTPAPAPAARAPAPAAPQPTSPVDGFSDLPPVRPFPDTDTRPAAQNLRDAMVRRSFEDPANQAPQTPPGPSRDPVVANMVDSYPASQSKPQGMPEPLLPVPAVPTAEQTVAKAPALDALPQDGWDAEDGHDMGQANAGNGTDPIKRVLDGASAATTEGAPEWEAQDMDPRILDLLNEDAQAVPDSGTRLDPNAERDEIVRNLIMAGMPHNGNMLPVRG